MTDNIKTIGPVPEGAEAILLSEMSDKPILFVCANDRDMDRTKQCLKFFAPKREVIEFPAWDTLPYDRSSPNPQIMSQRISTLAKLANKNVSRETFIILTTVNAILQKLPPKETFQDNFMLVEKGREANREQIISFLAKNGYDRVSKVIESGEFAVRGSIIDIFPSGAEDAIRIDFFDDQVENIKEFDALSQISSGELKKFQLLPASEIILEDDTIEIFRRNYRATFGAAVKNDPLYEAVINRAKYPGVENWLPLFYQKLSSFFDYLPADILLIQGRLVEEALHDRLEIIDDYYSARLETSDDYLPVPHEQFYLPNINPNCLEIVQFSAFNDDEVISSGFKKTPKIGKSLETIKSNKKQTFISCFSRGSLSHIEGLLKSSGLESTPIKTWSERKNVSRETSKMDVGIFTAPIESGFENDDYIIISEQDIFGDRFVRSVKKKKKAANFLEEASSIEINELVVHENHGVGKFVGLETLEVDGIKHDMVRLLYSGDDRLFVPVENIDLISRYGANDSEANLDRLGGASWQERTSKLKERIKLAADELLKVAAERAIKTAAKITIEEGLYGEFCSRFPYVETEDQLNSIADIFEDLSKGRPMDRLVCGDVGFGKTEVALRAAFAAAASGGQVAVISPTTLLCRQHYKTFTDRFQDMPFELCHMSRMVSATEIKKNKELLKEGRADIVIGTHALLADDMKFKNLSLVIIDEEQHFGVAQKEKLKKLKANVHVLCLSATPIPRSLQLAISGVRELSLIATPPVDRLAVRTFVTPFDEITIREAILRERNRGGQVFYVAPRIADLKELYKILTNLVPEARIAQAHGQMKPAELDDIMNQFYDAKFDVLLSTAIVESGLDVQSANTLFVHNADMFGLSQLYQLRGRVGRGKTRGYAYFTLHKNKALTKNAYKRLEVIQGLDSLGAGFSIASHDMDIRGFGNLLGDEQSGHVREVGVELYQKMLREAVMRAKAEGEAEEHSETFTPNINLGMSVLIPDNYVLDLDLRMSLYKRAARLSDADEIDSFVVEVTDRFGKPPQEFLCLLEVIRLKIVCRNIGIAKIDAGPKAVVMQFIDNPSISPEDVFEFANSYPGRVKIKPDNKLVFSLQGQTRDQVIEMVNNDLNILAGFVSSEKENAA